MNQIPSPNSAIPEDSTTQVVSAQATGTRILPVIEERVSIGRELVETGRVRLTRQVHETQEHLNIPLQHEEVQVERVTLNLTLPAGTPAPGIRHEGTTMIIPVLREIAVVETRLLLVEELHVTTQHHHTEHTETVQLRREEIQVEHLPASAPSEVPAT